jgi:hypothetical protein
VTPSRSNRTVIFSHPFDTGHPTYFCLSPPGQGGFAHPADNGPVAASATTRRTRRKPVPANDGMTKTVEALLADLGPLDPARAVHAELAKRLAATLDAMGPSVAARMVGQTSGQLLKVLDKLGAQRGGGIVPTSGRPRTVAVGDDAAPEWVQMSRDGVTPLADAPLTDEYWYDGFEDSLYVGKLEGIIMRHGRRRGLPLPGSPAYNQAPWAVDPYEWVAEQKEKAATKPFRPLAVLEHGDPANNVVPLRG